MNDISSLLRALASRDALLTNRVAAQRLQQMLDDCEDAPTIRELGHVLAMLAEERMALSG